MGSEQNDDIRSLRLRTRRERRVFDYDRPGKLTPFGWAVLAVFAFVVALVVAAVAK